MNDEGRLHEVTVDDGTAYIIFALTMSSLIAAHFRRAPGMRTAGALIVLLPHPAARVQLRLSRETR